MKNLSFTQTRHFPLIHPTEISIPDFSGKKIWELENQANKIPTNKQVHDFYANTVQFLSPENSHPKCESDFLKQVKSQGGTGLSALNRLFSRKSIHTLTLFSHCFLLLPLSLASSDKISQYWLHACAACDEPNLCRMHLAATSALYSESE